MTDPVTEARLRIPTRQSRRQLLMRDRLPISWALAGSLSSATLAADHALWPAAWPAQGLDYFAGMSDGGARELRAAARGQAELQEVLAANEFDPESFIPADYAALEGSWSWFNGIVEAATADGFDGMVADLVGAMAAWGFDPAAVSAPTLIMHGTADRMVPSSHSEWLAAHCPAAELRLQPEAGHISVLDSAPGALAWLRQVVTDWS